MAKTRKDSIAFFKTISSLLNELIGYIELTDSNEIWPKHLLSIKKRNFKGFAIILDFFTRRPRPQLAANHSILKLYLPLIRQLIRIQKKPDTRSEIDAC